MQAEKVIEKQIRAYLDKRPQCWHIKTHGSMFQQTGIPDIIGVDRGRFFAFEIKRLDGKATPKQLYILQLISKAGGLCGVVRSTVEVINLLGPVIEETLLNECR